MSSDPPWKDGNVWITTIPLKALSDQVWIEYKWFLFFYFENWLFSIWDFCIKVTCEFLRYRKTYWNRTVPYLQEGSLEITLTVPLIRELSFFFAYVALCPKNIFAVPLDILNIFAIPFDILNIFAVPLDILKLNLCLSCKIILLLLISKL